MTTADICMALSPVQGAFHTLLFQTYQFSRPPRPHLLLLACPCQLQPQSSFSLETPFALESETPNMIFVLLITLFSNWQASDELC